jgi:glycosyltransferase involved in cell wall biosynthesis
MATGMPIITTDVPGCRQTVIDRHNGFMVPKSDSIALSKAMLSFINDKTLINKMGRESRMMAIDKYDMNNVVNSIIKCLLKD